jgi:hypothetical protein
MEANISCTSDFHMLMIIVIHMLKSKTKIGNQRREKEINATHVRWAGGRHRTLGVQRVKRILRQ